MLLRRNKLQAGQSRRIILLLSFFFQTCSIGHSHARLERKSESGVRKQPIKVTAAGRFIYKKAASDRRASRLQVLGRFRVAVFHATFKSAHLRPASGLPAWVGGRPAAL